MKYQIPQIKLVTVQETQSQRIRISAPEHINALMSPIIHETETDQETLWVIALDTRYRVIHYKLVSLGTVSACNSHAREIFRSAIIANASAVILVHSHPSGEVDPSQADIQVTRKLTQASEVIGIPILDHIIIGIGSGQHSSLKELGYIH